MPANRLKSIVYNRRHVYERIKGKLGKRSAARIANAGKNHAARSRMAKKAAATRKRRGR